MSYGLTHGEVRLTTELLSHRGRCFQIAKERAEAREYLADRLGCGEQHRAEQRNYDSSKILPTVLMSVLQVGLAALTENPQALIETLSEATPSERRTLQLCLESPSTFVFYNHFRRSMEPLPNERLIEEQTSLLTDRSEPELIELVKIGLTELGRLVYSPYPWDRTTAGAFMSTKFLTREQIQVISEVIQYADENYSHFSIY